MRPNLLDVVACPRCKDHLEQNGSQLFCSSCTEYYSLQSGVFRAQKNKYYWGEIDQVRMQDLLKNARAVGWLNALEGLPKEIKNSVFDYITRANRADWRFNLPLNHHARVLDLGSGWGQIPFLLAEAYDEVWSLEYIEERIDWQQIRKEQEKKENLYLVQSDVMYLPFLDETFDIISMNGVLEWIGIAKMDSKVSELQLQVLSDVFRILKPGGYLYIGIENRIGYNMFLGAFDHSGMRFTSLMPRWLANQYVKHFKKNSHPIEGNQHGYRTYTYSPPGYRKLLREAGFSNIVMYWVMPSHNNPIVFAPINQSRKIDYFFRQIKPNNIIKKSAKILICTLVRWGFMQLFSPYILIYAQRKNR